MVSVNVFFVNLGQKRYNNDVKGFPRTLNDAKGHRLPGGVEKVHQQMHELFRSDTWPERYALCPQYLINRRVAKPRMVYERRRVTPSDESAWRS